MTPEIGGMNLETLKRWVDGLLEQQSKISFEAGYAAAHHKFRKTLYPTTDEINGAMEEWKRIKELEDE